MSSSTGTSLSAALRAVAGPVVLAGVLVAALAGCGSAEPAGTAQDATSGLGADGGTASCAPDSAVVRAAARLTEADLDGDGTPDEVRVTGPGGECGDLLVATVGEESLTVPLADGPAVTGGYAVALPGRDGQLLVTSADHPRGGYQLRVYAAGEEGLVELRTDAGTLVPFVATDVEEHPFSVECTDGGVVLTEAVTHEPVGVVAAWDVQRTSYTVEGTTVTAGPTDEIADNVLPGQLGRRYPDLVRHSAFAGCRA